MIKGFKPEIKAAFIINRRITNTSISREVEEALDDYEFPLLKTTIGQRVIFSEASAGYSVMELSPSSTASTEIKKLSKEVMNMMGLKKW